MRTLEKIEKDKKRKDERRLLILRTYSSNINPFCACCGEKEIRFLVLDHIAGGGSRHRKEVSKSRGGTAMYLWIIKNDFPKGFQILCHNCNQAKSFYKICPHKE